MSLISRSATPPPTPFGGFGLIHVRLTRPGTPSAGASLGGKVGSQISSPPSAAASPIPADSGWTVPLCAEEATRTADLLRRRKRCSPPSVTVRSIPVVSVPMVPPCAGAAMTMDSHRRLRTRFSRPSAAVAPIVAASARTVLPCAGALNEKALIWISHRHLRTKSLPPSPVARSILVVFARTVLWCAGAWIVMAACQRLKPSRTHSLVVVPTIAAPCAGTVLPCAGAETVMDRRLPLQRKNSCRSAAVSYIPAPFAQTAPRSVGEGTTSAKQLRDADPVQHPALLLYWYIAGVSVDDGGRVTDHGDNRFDVRPLKPLDAVRCAAVGGGGLPNLAITVTGLCQPRSFRRSLLGLSRRRFSPRSRDNAWVLTDGAKVRGIASVRIRSGAKSWELSHLYVDLTDRVSVARLLEKAAAAAASTHGAERVFLRVDSGSLVIPVARLAGFFPCFGETLYRGVDVSYSDGSLLFDAENRLRSRRPADDYNLFRLFNASTPVRVRQLTGMTFDQWRASLEPRPGRRSERVFEVDGEIKASLETTRRFNTANLSVMLHPDYAGLTEDIVEAGIRQVSRAGTVFALVEDHAPEVASALERRGLTPSGHFQMLVKSTARTFKEHIPARSSLAAAE